MQNVRSVFVCAFFSSKAVEHQHPKRQLDQPHSLVTLVPNEEPPALFLKPPFSAFQRTAQDAPIDNNAENRFIDRRFCHGGSPKACRGAAKRGFDADRLDGPCVRCSD